MCIFIVKLYIFAKTYEIGLFQYEKLKRCWYTTLSADSN